MAEAVPDDFKRFLVLRATADEALVFNEEDPEVQLKVVIVGVWALPEGVLDRDGIEKFVFVFDPLDAKPFLHQLESVVDLPSVSEQVEEENARLEL